LLNVWMINPCEFKSHLVRLLQEINTTSKWEIKQHLFVAVRF
jgi:hypothetical protein